jgi:hypothetical protein
VGNGLEMLKMKGKGKLVSDGNEQMRDDIDVDYCNNRGDNGKETILRCISEVESWNLVMICPCLIFIILEHIAQGESYKLYFLSTYITSYSLPRN